MINKLSTYIGFAKKSNKIVVGTDNIIASNKCKIVLVSDELSDNSKKKIEKIYKVFKISANVFNEVVNMEAVKAVAITDENLASAIRNLLEVQ